MSIIRNLKSDSGARCRLAGGWLLALTLLGLALGGAGCSKSPTRTEASAQSDRPRAERAQPAAPWFEEVGAKANLNFSYSTGQHPGRFWMPEIKGGGVGLLDYDSDGLLDVFCVQAGSLDPVEARRPSHRLFHNLGNWRFEDVTEKAGLVGNGSYGMGCACGDYNGDGWVDIYVTTYGTNLLYRNNGNGTFTDVTREAGVGNVSWGMSAAFFDYDGDSHLDLMVANYVKWSSASELNCFARGGLPDYCSPLNYKAPAMDTLFHNRGDGTFENVTVAAGLDRAYGNGLGVVCADFNHDGRADIFVANDATPNQLWINQGQGKFVDEAMLRGCAVNSMGLCEAGMGIAAVDVFQRGWLDLFVTHLEDEANRLFYNTNGCFIDSVTPKGPGATSWPYTSFGVGCFDFDNDGQLDCYIANGRVKHGPTDLDSTDPYAEPSNLLRGLGNGQFEEVFPQGGTAPPLLATSRGAAFGDLDNDGGIDIVVVNRDRPIRVLRNLAANRGHSILLRVLDRKGRWAIGAEARLEAGGTVYWRSVLPNQSYASSNDPRIHCGLGNVQTIERVVLRWPDGSQESFGPYQADQIQELRQGAGQVAAGVFGY